MSSSTQFSSLSPDDTVLKLPHPYNTEFTIHKASSTSSSSTQLYQIIQKFTPDSRANPFSLVSPNLHFSEPTDLKSSEAPPPSNNSAWGRARRSPCVTCQWSGGEAPSQAQAWLLLYVLFTVRPGMESLRVELSGKGAARLGQQLCDVLLAVQHPLQPKQQRSVTQDDEASIVAMRSTFWQGAGSPFGPRPVWCPDESPASLSSTNLSSFPLTPLLNTTSIQLAGDPQDPERHMQAWHPIRPAKPAPGAVIYSRWIPHLKETFSMVSLDYEDAEHLRLFHEWQNDPRVSQGWNETGTLDQHREYLRKIHEDPHQVAVLAKWEDTFFAYFEVYWAKVSPSTSHKHHNHILTHSTGGPSWCLLLPRRLRPRPPLPRRRRPFPRPSPRNSLVVQPNALPLPRRPTNHGRRRRAKRHKLSGRHVRSDPRLWIGKVC